MTPYHVMMLYHLLDATLLTKQYFQKLYTQKLIATILNSLKLRYNKNYENDFLPITIDLTFQLVTYLALGIVMFRIF